MNTYSLKPGYGWNPLKRYRNIPCACGSGKKSKHCHGVFESLPDEHIAKVKAYLRELSMRGLLEVRKGEIQ